jgi:hypothetical protein
MNVGKRCHSVDSYDAESSFSPYIKEYQCHKPSFHKLGESIHNCLALKALFRCGMWARDAIRLMAITLNPAFRPITKKISVSQAQLSETE